MTKRIPLGEKESFRLEFKGAEALKNPEKVAREVVALLNADGGEVWVGLQEEEGRAVRIEAVPNPELEARRLFDSLVDSIEPSLSESEVRVQVREDEGKAVLQVEATPRANRRPYAFLKKGGRHFVVRVGDRIRPMARDEILSRQEVSGDARDEALIRSMKKLWEERRRLQEERKELLWLRIEPVQPVELEIQDSIYEDYLLRPPLTGNRVIGWTFARFFRRPIVRKDRLITDPEDFKALERGVEIRRDGGMDFTVPLSGLLHSKGGAREIWPIIFIEYVVSAFRMATKVLAPKLQPGDRVLSDLSLLGIQGWHLRPGSPDHWRSSDVPQEFTEAEDLVWEKPLVFTSGEIEAEPDRCALRLIERVYEAFGFRRDQIPQELDQLDGRLILPE